MSDQEKINQLPNEDNQPVENESVNSEASVLNEEQSTTTQQPSTENMEVHYHPQVEKKGFKEYFLEFLMIFLAVSIWLNKP